MLDDARTQTGGGAPALDALLALACACAGIIIGVVALTGAGIVFTQAVLGIAQNTLLLALVMTGVIWTVQLVVYPAFRLVPDDGWRAYHAQHSRRITYVVGPVMLVELATGVLLIAGDTVDGALPWVAFGATLVALGMTGAVHSPDHGRLGAGPARRIVDRLITTGWLRTAAWSTHGVVALTMLAGS